MLLIRKIHLYLGTLFAPAIIFFAVSGVLQVLGLHEAEDADAPQPPAWIVAIASIHKDQHLPRPKAHKLPGAIEQMRSDHVHEHAHEHDDQQAHGAAGNAGPAAPAATAGAGDARNGMKTADADGANAGAKAGAKPSADAADWSQWLLKAFALAMATALVVSAALGIYIAIANTRTRRVAILMLAVGVLLPLGMLAI